MMLGKSPVLYNFVTFILVAFILCLKRPSFNCLIHFYKRCVSTLAWIVHSACWVFCLCQSKTSLFRAKESSLLNSQSPLHTVDVRLVWQCYVSYARCSLDREQRCRWYDVKQNDTANRVNRETLSRWLCSPASNWDTGSFGEKREMSALEEMFGFVRSDRS